MSRYSSNARDDYPLDPPKPRHFPHFSDDDEEHGPSFGHGLGTEQLKGLEDKEEAAADNESSSYERETASPPSSIAGGEPREYFVRRARSHSSAGDSPEPEIIIRRRSKSRSPSLSSGLGYIHDTRSSKELDERRSSFKQPRTGRTTRARIPSPPTTNLRSSRKAARSTRPQEGSLALTRYSRTNSERSKVHLSEEDEATRLRKKIADLEARLAENNIPRASTPPPASLGYRSVTIYELGVDSERYYLDEPQWVIGDTNTPVLLAYKGISSLRRYLDNHPEISVLFLRAYHSRPPKDLSQISDSDGVLRAPKPEAERLELIASEMIEAFENFTRLVPDFDEMFPRFDSNAPITAPFQVMYYCSSFLEDCLPKLDTIHAKLIEQVFDAVNRKYGRQFSLANKKVKKGLVDKRSLPFLIKPGDILVEIDGPLTQAYEARSWLRSPTSYHADSAADPDRAAAELDRSEPDGSEPVRKSVLAYEVAVVHFTFDGDFRRERKSLQIKLTSTYDDDDVDIVTLNVYPIAHAATTIRQDLHRRGTMLWQCRHHRLVNYNHDTGSHLENASDRFIVDMKTYRKMNPSKAKSDDRRIARYTEYYTSSEMANDDLPSSDEALTFPPIVFGYNLRTKKWRKLLLHYVVDVVWNKKAFDHLVAEEKTKTLMKALVTNQLAESESTDVIDAKGGGLVLLLHGGPGTGKTFTAEGVAEFAEKPLLRVTCGDAGVEAREVERYLQNVFRLGHLWDCVVLLDEADVFLEERDIRDLNRNALVSVFLRILEYYQGILILTSNRVGTFDEAFKSRIQLALHYQKHGKPERKKIWRNFLTRVRDMPTSNMDYDDIVGHLEDLAEYKLNGREIRNVVTTARQLARFEGGKLRYTHVKDALDVTCKFGDYLTTLFKKTPEQRLKEAEIRS